MKLKELFESEERSVRSVLKNIPEGKEGFFVDNKQLTSLDGCPHTVGETFSCSYNKLKSLKGGPREVGHEYYCNENFLTSLEYAPRILHGHFNCSRNKIESLEGCPIRVEGNFIANNNELTSLKGIHKQIKFVDGYMDFSENPIKSHVLGLLRIPGLSYIYAPSHAKQVGAIINKYLKIPIESRDIIECQDELMAAGFEDFTQL
jgi:hypothetical protein